jgi:tungstate transport system substrate-binding protein
MRSLKKIMPLLFVLCMVLSPFAFADDTCKATYGSGTQTIRLATGSPGELGLVEVLADAFNKTHGSRLCWKKAGSGASLKLLKEKKVDFVMVHAPAAEKMAVKDGWATDRHLIGSNEFYIVGPKNDPAGIAKAGSVAEAYVKIAAAKALFLSRGDNSGTHKKEMAIWKQANVQPSGDWYVTTHAFMMATLKMADRKKGYFMTDSSTWVAAVKELSNLKILFKGDPFLINTYHTLCQPTGATGGQPLASEFISFVISDKGQHIINSYGAAQYGTGLYNDAAYAKKYDH